MRKEILKVIRQLQIEIEILDIDEKKLTDVYLSMEKLNEVVKKLTI